MLQWCIIFESIIIQKHDWDISLSLSFETVFERTREAMNADSVRTTKTSTSILFSLSLHLIFDSTKPSGGPIMGSHDALSIDSSQYLFSHFYFVFTKCSLFLFIPFSFNIFFNLLLFYLINIVRFLSIYNFLYI